MKKLIRKKQKKLAEDLGAIFMSTYVRSPESIKDLFLEIAKKHTGCSEVTIIEEDDYGILYN